MKSGLSVTTALFVAGLAAISASTLAAKDAPTTGTLNFVDNSAQATVTVRDGETNILSYRFGDQIVPGVDPKYIRSCYIHPLYSLDGVPVTDDFPSDHFHHRGVFWTWPVVKARDKASQTWMPADPRIRQHFSRWIERKVTDQGARLSIENNWLLEDKEEIARELVTIDVAQMKDSSRAIDISIQLEAVGGPLTLQGTPEEKKGYGGFCFRAAPEFKGARLLTDSGEKDKDVVNEPNKWVDLSTTSSGVAVFVASDTPGFPPPWLARSSYAGFLNPEWPGLTPAVLEPGKPVTLKYRLLVHRGDKSAADLKKAFAEFGTAKAE